MKKFNLLSSMPIHLILAILFVLFFGHNIDIFYKECFLAISLTIKNILILFLPFMIFSFIFASILELNKGAFKIIVMLILAICLSNFTCSWIGYLMSKFLPSATLVANSNYMQGNLKPLWEFKQLKLISNDFALFSALVLGIICAYFQFKKINFIAARMKITATKILEKIFIPIVPIFIFGFLLKLDHESNLVEIIIKYSKTFSIVFLGQMIYITILFLAATQFNITKMLFYIKNIVPACMVAFTAMSSAAAMPVSINAVEKNLGDKSRGKLILPISTNIHLIGDCIFIPIFAIAIIASYGGIIPDFQNYLIFSLYFIIAKFAVAAVPGGGIIVMIPVLSKFFNMNAEMLSLITTLYILFDAFITTTNTLGNNLFAVIFSRVIYNNENKNSIK